MNHLSSSPATHWTVEIGTICLWIIGPGTAAMVRASRSYYTGTIGTPHERAIAQRAVMLLDRDHRHNPDAGAPEVRAALEDATRQIRRGLPMPVAGASGSCLPPPLPQRSAAPPAPVPTQEDVRRIVAAVAKETGLAPARWIRPTTGAARHPSVRKSRVLCVHVSRTLFPKAFLKDLDAPFGLPPNTHSNLIRESPDTIRQPSYAGGLANILTRLSPLKTEH